MTGLTIALLLLLLQFLMGFGVLTLCRIRLKPGMFLPLAVLLGVAVCGMVPFALQLALVPVTSINVLVALLTTCLLLNLQFKRGRQELQGMLRATRFRMALYEIPFLLIVAAIVLVSVWRCYYYPPTPRDFTSGAEVIAEYTVRENTMINSVFSLSLERFNNHFKSPFLISLQVIYKFAGFPFGQIWLCNVFVCFIMFLYHALNLSLHRLLSGVLILLFLAIPEMYAYSFMVLFDYSNAVFFFLSAWFVFAFMNSGNRRLIAFAGLLMGIATYIRPETLVLGALLYLAVAWKQLRDRQRFGRILMAGIYFMLPSALFYCICIYVYINFYLPIPYHIDGLMNQHLLNLRPLWQRFAGMNTELIFSRPGVTYYGYFVFIFLLVLVCDVIYGRGLNSHARRWLYAVLVVYLGLALLGYLLPLLDLFHSTKRGLFKMFPLMLLYMAGSKLLTDISASIKKWEAGG